MKTLTAALLAELGLTVTRPGYLVEIDFATPLRLSTLGDISFAGQAWTAADIQVRGLSADQSGQQAGSLILANTLADYGVLILDEGIADRAIRVWACYAGATADALEVFNGVGDEARWDASGRITLTLADSALRTAFWPRQRINAASGFTKLIPAGTRIVVAGQPYVLERR